MKGIMVDKGLRIESCSSSELRSHKSKEEPGKVTDSRITGL